MLYAKGDIVKYKAGESTIRAVVIRAHRDGTRTVQARHHLNDRGEPVGPYLGFNYRIPTYDLHHSS